MKKFKVEVTAMNPNLSDEAIRRTESFDKFSEAYSYYNELCDMKNLDNAEYSDVVEMNHSAGGIGYEFRIELICL